ncbi:MAG: hypothetical protein KY464_16300 [Gemmatimonadetes bacterium]|nr:hypothetical protein [Gemmatimonadota bacterium]
MDAMTAARKGTLIRDLLIFQLKLVLDSIKDVALIQISLVAAIYVIIGVGMHVILGEAGLLHLGYAAFLGVGAYIIGLG